MNVRHEVRRRGRGTIAMNVVLQPRSSPSVCEISLTQKLLSVSFAFLSIQLKPLAFDILFSGELSAIGMDVGNYSSVGESDESVVDKVAVD